MAALRCLLAILVLAACVAPGRAAPPEAALADLWQTIQAHQYLQEDEVLASLNLGLKVRGRVATLWGPVPSLELALRAERRLRTMIELIDVRNELVVTPDDRWDEIVPEPRRPLFLPQRPLPEMRPPPRRDGAAAS